jgi:hypothetical protein
VLLGATVIIGYTLVGGYKAVAWTDLVQGLLMLLGLIVLPAVAINAAGGWGAVTDALASIGMQAVRAWGGLSSEEYYLSLLMLISRSGAMLAELATGNPNVYNEIGIAHGTLRPVFLVCRAPGEKVPSNIGHIPVCVYDDRTTRWRSKERRRLAEYMRWILLEFERRYAPAYRQFLAEQLEPRNTPTSTPPVTR